MEIRQKDEVVFSELNMDFVRVKDQVIGCKKCTFLEIGCVVLEGDEEAAYLILVDNEGILLRQNLKFQKHFLEMPREGAQFAVMTEDKKQYMLYFSLCMTTNDGNYNEHKMGLTFDQLNKYKTYIGSLKEFEKVYVGDLKQRADYLLRNDESKGLLYSFLHQYVKDDFHNIKDIYYRIDFLLMMFFRREERYKETRKRYRSSWEDEDYQKLLKILRKRGYIQEELSEYDSLLLFNFCLREISVELFADEFEKAYKGYFVSVEDMSIDECVDAYFQIDFINQTDDKDISSLTYYLFAHHLFFKNETCSLLEAYELVEEKVMDYKANEELHLFERQLQKNQLKESKEEILEGILSISEVDLLSGTEFEVFVSILFKKLGYSVGFTPATGDQGIDLIAVKNGIRVGIQTKCYASSVSNKAIQEVAAGIKYYGLDKAIVITNNYFTKSAVDLALSTDVVLWDRNILSQKLVEISSMGID